MIFARLRKAFGRDSTPDTPSLPAKPAIPPGQLVYAIGDIHGEVDLLRRLLERVRQDMAQRSDLAATVVFLGDYIDRGPDSRGVLELLLSDPLPGARLRFLRGNHEQTMLEFLVDPLAAADWLRFGGVETLSSYGVRAPPGPLEPDRLRQLAASLAERLPPAHLSFLQNTTFMAAVGDYAFVHAGIRPGIALNRQKQDDLLWIREEFLDKPFQSSHVIVHGHTITDEPELLPHRIGLDTGAYASGILTALILQGQEREVMQVQRGG
ncbi:serine/threonine protein phosphatase [Niveispirillum sp. SYP-B3756]|uniref:metallophosphoesterase family protein n=1 Tax=Niveispirillum sp. SYP-B3756 TaxID=2662178 RepID=UPI001291A56B|nr:metallophosphoesterase family protein [Niveispirillum sp. SYP-B3756]MQP68450.1 serine/threonine protein phosphatase [Niveispirillum sp. SYP-B3756]